MFEVNTHMITQTDRRQSEISNQLPNLKPLEKVISLKTRSSCRQNVANMFCQVLLPQSHI